MRNSKQLDKYYTKESVVKKCLRQVDLDAYDFVIDPSVGSGSFYNRIPHTEKVAIDIAPEMKDAVTSDYLEYEISDRYRKVLVIGNPPFGRNHSLSTAFLTHSLSFANVSTIAFVLPDVYKKHTRQRFLPNNWRIKSITALGRYPFTIDGDDYHIQSSFFVFDRSAGKDLRFDPKKYAWCSDFDWGTKENFDVFMFGASPKKVIMNPTSNNRGHFIKSKIGTTKLIDNIKNIDWTGLSCANGGVYWLTKSEVIKQYNETYYPE